ncbi:MAG: ester cyclase [Anaerolineae bacterium]|nr:ester cyclase [Anaerolineae bacterium]
MLINNKTIAHRYLEEVFSKGNVAAIDEITAVNFVSHDPAAGGEIRGVDGFKQFVTAIHTVFPDIQFTVEDMLAEGDRVAVRWTMHSEHEGEGLGLPATHRPVTVTGAEFLRIVNGKIEEDWVTLDTLRLVNDMGLLEPKPMMA